MENWNLNKKYVRFLKPVEFLNIQKGEVFKIYLDYDKRPFIKLKTKQHIYLTNWRYDLGYFNLFKYKILKNI